MEKVKRKTQRGQKWEKPAERLVFSRFFGHGAMRRIFGIKFGTMRHAADGATCWPQ